MHRARIKGKEMEEPRYEMEISLEEKGEQKLVSKKTKENTKCFVSQKQQTISQRRKVFQKPTLWCRSLSPKPSCVGEKRWQDENNLNDILSLKCKREILRKLEILKQGEKSTFYILLQEFAARADAQDIPTTSSKFICVSVCLVVYIYIGCDRRMAQTKYQKLENCLYNIPFTGSRRSKFNGGATAWYGVQFPVLKAKVRRIKRLY